MQLKTKISALALSLLLSGCYVNMLPGSNNVPAEAQPAPAQVAPAAVQPIIPGQPANPQIAPQPVKPCLLPGQTRHLLLAPQRMPAPAKVKPMTRCEAFVAKQKDKKHPQGK